MDKTACITRNQYLRKVPSFHSAGHILPKNFICYTATVQQATFQTDLDLRQAGLGLSVQLRIRVRVRILSCTDSLTKVQIGLKRCLLYCCCVIYEVWEYIFHKTLVDIIIQLVVILLVVANA